MTGTSRQAECYCGAYIASVDGGAWFTSGSWPPVFKCYPGESGADGDAEHQPLEGTVRG